MNQFLEHIKPILTIADRDTDSEEIKRSHSFLIYMGLLMSTGGLLWGTICLANGLYIPAIIPYAYIAITIVNFTYLFISKNFAVSQIIQILISLLLPFLFQFFLGGFIASGGNILWSVLAIFGSFTLQKKQMTFLWFILFILLIIVSGFVDSDAKQFDIGLPEVYSIFFFVINFILTISIIFSLYYYFASNEEKAREELQESLKQLNQTQNQLIESEKMASLSTLVSGVAHEINTPLGVALTGISQIAHEVKKLEANYQNEMLTEEALNEYIVTMKQLTQVIHDRLDNAALLVKSFKHISADQHFEDRREFYLKKYIDDLFLGLQNSIKSKRVQIVNTIEETLMLESFPGIFSQIFSNLILNSIKHGFERNGENIIKISVELNDHLIIYYQDNGIGITDEIEKKIFDPFFTTKRGEGGSGLGLNVVYNLITQKLKGKLSLVRVLPHGLGLRIILDKEIILKV